ncbi:hypothetical protein N7537_005399 [Penicillium hordei]|uniref:Cytochrome P450 n=1 Tax=Penicillium hordei TaxID=40994 RepID=A0AAD6E5P3_9EURO|nr:uncharacterized protein N7537_005399 [Penicillium hordei]KAJ5602443.1 hypothetical protein N7537_005399 [Penicillium hordei]
MNRELVHLTQPLSDEVDHCLQAQWSENSEWHTVSTHDTVLALVPQMTKRAFVGAELCRNAEWLDIAISFTINRAIAVQAIQAWPWILQPVGVRRQIQRARDILMPVLERERQVMHSKDMSTDRVFSTLTFIDQYANGSRYDATMAQLRLTAVSVLTTSDMVEKVLARICEYPELIQPLREEAILAVESGGLHHKSLLKLTLMESVMKESQRLEPATLISMFRVAKRTVILQDGTTIPKGTSVAFANDLRLDPVMYPDPEKFDDYRFEEMRKDPEQASLPHSPRQEQAIWLSVMGNTLVLYDLKALDGRVPDLHIRGMFIQRDTGGMLSVRRRQEEVTL